MSSTTAKPTVVPNPPTSVVMSVVNDQTLRVMFNPPTSDGGDVITEYMVELDRSPSFNSSITSPYGSTAFNAEFLGPVMYLGGGAPYVFTFQGLTTGQQYYARVRASNGEGYGSPQISSPPFEVPRRRPGIPMNVDVQATSSSEATVRFEPPADDGGESVTLYKVEWDITPACNSNAAPPHKGTVILSALTSNYFTIRDLKEGQAYYVRVSAANSMGYGPSTRSSTSVTPRNQLPGIPTSLNAFFDKAFSSIKLSWAPPTIPFHGLPCNGTLAKPGLCPGGTADGGSKITSFFLKVDSSPKFDSGKAGVFEVPVTNFNGLQYYTISKTTGYTVLANTEYYIRVFAKNENGIGRSTKPVKVLDAPITKGPISGGSGSSSGSGMGRRRVQADIRCPKGRHYVQGFGCA